MHKNKQLVASLLFLHEFLIICSYDGQNEVGTLACIALLSVAVNRNLIRGAKPHQQLKGSSSKFTIARPGNATPGSSGGRLGLYPDTESRALLTCPGTPAMWPEFSEGQRGILGLTFSVYTHTHTHTATPVKDRQPDSRTVQNTSYNAMGIKLHVINNDNECK